MTMNSKTRPAATRCLLPWLIAAVLVLSAMFAYATLTGERDGTRRRQTVDTYEQSIVLRVAYGDGVANVGLLPEGNDERSRGPASFALDGESILILDSEHGRILDFDRNGGVQRTINDIRGVDIAAKGSSIFVLDAASESVVRVSPDGSRSTVEGLPPDAIRLVERGGTIGYEQGDKFVGLEPISRAVTLSTALPREDDGVQFDYTDVDRHTGTVRDRSTGITLTIKTAKNLGSMNVVGVDDKHNVFVAVEQLLEGGAALRVTKEVRKFAADGSLRAVIPINIDYVAHPVREFVVTPDGTLYHLLPLRNVLLVEEWRER